MSDKTNAEKPVLTQELVKHLFDYMDGKLVWKNPKSPRVKPGDIAGNISKLGYIRVQVCGKLYFAHRIIFIYCNGYNPENPIDHTDRDKLNNNIENLREITQQCNMRNAKQQSNNTSGVRGVGWHKRIGKWYAQIRANKSCNFLGYFDNFNKAVKARHNAEIAVNWAGCDSTSPSFLYLKKTGLL